MNVTVLRVESIIDGESIVIHPVLLQRGQSSYLVDCDYAGGFEALERALLEAGTCVEDIRGVILTHDDHDHLGGMRWLMDRNPALQLYCGEHERDAVSGRVKSERLLQAESLLASMPEESKDWARGFIRMLESVHRFEPGHAFKDQEIFEQDITILHTPGHTRGHISLYIASQSTLIAGDALVIEDGAFDIANPAFTLHMDAALRSVRRIRQLQPRRIICYHGGIMDEQVDERLRELIERYSEDRPPAEVL